MELFVVCLCVFFGLVSGDTELRKVAKENGDVIVESVQATFPTWDFSDDAKIIFHPGQTFLGANHNSSVPILFRSERAERMGVLASPRNTLKSRNVTKDSPKTARKWLRVYLERSDGQLNVWPKLAHRNITAKFSGSFRGVVDKRVLPVNYTRWRERLEGKKGNGGYFSVVRSRRQEPQQKKNIPEKLTAAMKATDYWENQLLLQFVTQKNRKTIGELTQQYNEAQREERWLLKRFVEGLFNETATEMLLVSYKALRTGHPPAANETSDVYVEFFQTPSDLLTEYKELKDNELEVDGYLEGTLQYPNEEEFDKEMSGRSEFKSLPQPIRKASDLSKLARLHNEEAALLPKVEQHPTSQGTSNSSAGAALGNDDSTTPQGGSVVDSNSTSPSEAETAGGQSPKSQLSYSIMKSLMSRLPDVLKLKMAATDEAEAVILGHYNKEESVPENVVDAYKAKLREERVLLREILTEAGSYAPQFLELYKAIRKGSAWSYLTLDGAFARFFKQRSDALTEYEALKRDEYASLDAFFLEPVHDYNVTTVQSENAATETTHATPISMEEEDVEIFRSKEKNEKQEETKKNEKREETKRKARAEKFGTEEMRGTETAGDLEAMTYRIFDDIVLGGSTDSVVVSTRRVPTNCTAKQKTSGTLGVVRLGIVLSVPINVILAVVILGLYRKEILEWYRLRKKSRATALDGEKEFLHSVRAATSV